MLLIIGIVFGPAGNYPVHQSVGHGFLGIHELVTLHVRFELVQWLSRGLLVDLCEFSFPTQ